jgi:protein-tyrosine phosphatase
MDTSEGLSRVAPLAGALNFRDMGGYRSAHGQSIRWNTLYRSGTTHTLTDADLGWLRARGVRFAYDLRSGSERSNQPNRLREIVDLRYRYTDHEQSTGNIRRMLRDAGARGEDARQTMLRLYRTLPYEFKDSYRALLLHLSEGDLPLVLNCSAGKDRTGVAAALILTVLEVPQPVILEDYLLTEQCFEQSCRMLLGTHVGLLDGIPRESWEPLMRTDADYLQSAFDELETRHGSVLGYVRSELGLSEKVIERIRGHLLV